MPIVTDVNIDNSTYFSFCDPVYTCDTTATWYQKDITVNTDLTSDPFTNGDQIYVRFTNGSMSSYRYSYLRIKNSSGTVICNHYISNGGSTAKYDTATGMVAIHPGTVVKFMLKDNIWCVVGDYCLSSVFSEGRWAVTATDKSITTTDNSSSNTDVTFSISKTGYYPLSIVGWNSENRKTCTMGFYLGFQTRGLGSCTIICKPWVPRYIGKKGGTDPSTSSSTTLWVYVLWVRNPGNFK